MVDKYILTGRTYVLPLCTSQNFKIRFSPSSANKKARNVWYYFIFPVNPNGILKRIT